MNGRVLAFLVACMIGLPTTSGPAGVATSPKAVVPTVIAPQLKAQYPLITQIGKAPPATIFNPYKLRAHMSASQSISAANQSAPNWQLVNIDTVDYDTANGFNASTHQYQISLNGYYQINARISSTRTTTTADFLAYGIALFRNGSELSRGAVDVRILKFSDGSITVILSGATAPFTAVHADQVKLFQGDLIDIRVANFANIGDSLNTDTTVNFWTVALIST